MINDERDELRRIFAVASAMAASERQAFLDAECGGDSELRAELDQLLEHHDDPVGFVDTLNGGRGDPIDPERISETLVGKRIGDYRVVRRIGGGGMGSVFEAEQEHPHRIVALKVLHPGIAGPGLLRRFEHEAEILARLQNPGIARIYDAGTADSGHGDQPFFAMELVDGAAITEYAAAERLAVRDRLELFARVCDAVHYAHTQGVVHRDLKPANILVDRAGDPRVLDFGVARVTDCDVQSATMHTGTGQLVGTVPYMSPEQAAGNPGEIDTRSDVYALGVVLFEVLTHRLPYALQGKMVHEAVRIIRESEPSRLSSVDTALRGDLDTIVGKALEKEKTRRYESAAALAADVRRYLADEPISARRPSATYQFRKFAKRNRVVVIAAAAVFVSLIAGTITTFYWLVEARDHQATAEQRTLEADSVIAFLVDMLQAASPGRLGRDAQVRDLLESVEQTIESVVDMPLVEARIRHTLGLAYMAVGEYFGPVEAHLQRSLELCRQELGEDHLYTAEAKDALGLLHLEHGRPVAAMPLVSAALEIRTTQLGADAPETVESMYHLARAHREYGDFAEARRVLEAGSRGLGNDAESLERLSIRAELGLLRLEEGGLNEARQILAETVAQLAASVGAEHPKTLSTSSLLGRALTEEDRFVDARETLDDTLARQTEIMGPLHPDTLETMQVRAALSFREGRVAQGAAQVDEVVEAMSRQLGRRHPRTLGARALQAETYMRQGRIAEASKIIDDLVADHGENRAPGHAGALATAYLAAFEAFARNQLPEAEAGVREVLASVDEHLAEGHGLRFKATALLANTLARQGANDKALEALEAALEVGSRHRGAEHLSVLSTRQNMASMLCRLGRCDEALPLHQEILETRRRLLGDEHPQTLDSENEVGFTLLEVGDSAPAETHLRRAIEGRKKVWGPGHHRTLTSIGNLAGALFEKGLIDKAEEMILEAIELARPEETAREILGMMLASYAGMKRVQDQDELALRYYLESYEVLAAFQAPSNPYLQAVIGKVAETLDLLDRSGEAAEWREKLSPPR